MLNYHNNKYFSFGPFNCFGREVGSSQASSGHGKRRKKDEASDGSLNAEKTSRACQLRYFSNIAGYNGVSLDSF
jgi:hypothetical protein